MAVKRLIYLMDWIESWTDENYPGVSTEKRNEIMSFLWSYTDYRGWHMATVKAKKKFPCGSNLKDQ